MHRTEYIFEPFPHQPATMLFNLLDVRETELVQSLVTWDNPKTVADTIRYMHGRSIVTQSPSRRTGTSRYFASEYDGLQIYGAGGSELMIREGVFEMPAQIHISQVRPENHAMKLSHILQMRDFDENGNLILTQRPYAPLHGMNETEAIHRKHMTDVVRQLNCNPDSSTPDSYYCVPEFAGEGIFPEKIDNEGRPLYFQIYRVPLIDRFPGQYVQIASNPGNQDQALFTFAIYSYLFGKFNHMLHDHNLAYMDGHAGNTSLISAKQQYVLYATDLGSIRDFSGHSFPNRFKGLDLYMFIESMKRLAEMTVTFQAQQYHFSESDVHNSIRSFVFVALNGYVTGYFDRNRSDAKHKVSIVKLMRQWYEKTTEIENILAYAITHGDYWPETFIRLYDAYIQ